MDDTDIKVEVNEKMIPPDKHGILAGGRIMVTPPIDENYWVMRVPLSPDQAVVAFPKFGTFGIGFQKEEDWNTNLPYTCRTEEIYNHIEHNKGDATITKERCTQAIRALQEAVAEMRGEDLEAMMAEFATR